MSADGAVSPVVFEVERFELGDDERIEVAGRWFGVRGVRFMRPSLIIRSEDGERSVLATLEHKPWAAEDGGRWVAAFPWRGGPVDVASAELAVAPSIVVPLSPETGAAGGGSGRMRKPTLRDRLEGEEQRARRLESEVAWLREEREKLIARSTEVVAEVEDSASARAADAEQAGAERDAAEEARVTAIRERDAALREREALAAERDELRRRVTSAERERDAALAEREAATGDDRGRDDLRHERDTSNRERDEALRRLSRAYRELDAATQARDAALDERDRAVERAQATAAPDDPAAGPAAAWRRDALAARRGRLASTSGGRADWVARGVAIVAVLSLLLLLFGLLRLF